MRALAYIAIISVIVSCSVRSYSEQEIKAYIQDQHHGLKKEKQVKGYCVAVTYRPADLLVTQELYRSDPDQHDPEGIREKYKHHYYFTLSLSQKDREALYSIEGRHRQFSELLQRLAFEMNKHVELTTQEQDTIPVADYIFSRTYDFGRMSNLLFAFHKEKVGEDEWVQFNLNEFGLGLGNQNFRFRKKDLDGVPGIDFTGS